MDKLRELLDELEIVDPAEWNNIPKPIIKGISSLKSCVQSQSSFLESLNKHFQDFESRCNLRIINVQKAISENVDKIRDNEESLKFILKTNEQKTKDTIDLFKKKITEDVTKDKSEIEERFNDIKDHVQVCHKRIDSTPTIAQLQSMINVAGERIIEKVKKDIKENMINPELYLLNQKINLLNS